jgi:hypothetical protein
MGVEREVLLRAAQPQTCLRLIGAAGVCVLLFFMPFIGEGGVPAYVETGRYGALGFLVGLAVSFAGLAYALARLLQVLAQGSAILVRDGDWLEFIGIPGWSTRFKDIEGVEVDGRHLVFTLADGRTMRPLMLSAARDISVVVEELRHLATEARRRAV